MLRRLPGRKYRYVTLIASDFPEVLNKDKVNIAKPLHMTEISLHVTLNNQLISPHLLTTLAGITSVNLQKKTFQTPRMRRSRKKYAEKRVEGVVLSTDLR